MVNKSYSASDLEAFMKIASNWQNNSLIEGADYKADMQEYMNASNPAMNMYKKRERTQNWNHQEKKFLLDLCKLDMQIIENKRLDAGLTAVKNKAWKIIHQKFSYAFGTDRTCNRLKEQWRRMKACTRNEIMDYNNRLQRFGQEVADTKKPSPFTFEIWEFMQEAKKACKSETLDGIDYSKMPLALEEDFDYKENDDDDENDNENSRTPPQELCDVNIKEEGDETDNEITTNLNDRLASSSPTHENDNSANLNESQTQQNFFAQAANDGINFNPSFNINNIAATLETLGVLRGKFPQQNSFVSSGGQSQQQQSSKRRRTSGEDHPPEMKVFMEMQAKEHFLRMKILETQLETAKFSRDIMEINKTMAMQKLKEFASNRMS